MNIDVLVPKDCLQLPQGLTVSAVASYGQEIYVGLSNGNLIVINNNEHEERPRVPSTLSTSLKSFNAVKALFSRQKTDHLLALETTFRNATGDARPVENIECFQLEPAGPVHILVSKSDSIRLFERAGSHLNLIQELNDSKPYYDIRLYKAPTGRAFVLTSLKKKLIVYAILSKNLKVLANFYKEIAFKERIKRIVIDLSAHNILVELVNDYKILSAEFQVSDLPVNEGELQSFTLASSFTYFGLAGTGPQSFAIPVKKSMFLLIRDLQAAILDITANTLSSSSFKASYNPCSVTLLPPSYILLVYAKKMEVIELFSGETIQVFNHQANSNSIITKMVSKELIFACGTDVLSFAKTDQENELQQYLKVAYSKTTVYKSDPAGDVRLVSLKRAIQVLISNNQNDHISKETLLRVREFQSLRAKIMFELYNRFHESLVEIGSEWILNYKEMLDLFPAFLNGLGSSKDPEKESNNSLKLVTLQDFLISKDLGSHTGESGTETEGPQGYRRRRESSLHKKFTKAVNNLIIFLTDQRRIALAFMNEDDASIEWKGVTLFAQDLFGKDSTTELKNAAKAIDTSLFLCYFYMKPMLLGPLLRLPNNFCDSTVVNECLLRGLHNHNADSVYIKELLDFYFTRNLHREALEMLFKMSHENIEDHENQLDEFLNGPSLTIQYLQKLSNLELDLIFEFACWVLKEHPDDAIENGKLIFMNDSFESEGYDNFKVLDFLTGKGGLFKSMPLASRYLEWLLKESDVLAGKPKREEMESEFETRLCLIYLEELDNCFQQSVYDKLFHFLQEATRYKPWTVLKQLKTTDDRFLRLSVFVYKLLGEHDKAIDVLFGQLNDFDSAMDYAALLFMTPSSPQHLDNRERGEKLLFKLLDDLLMDYGTNMDKIERLLEHQGSKMSVMHILASLPALFPLNRLAAFLRTHLLKTKQLSQNTNLISQLNKVGMVKTHYERAAIESHAYKIDSGRQPCAICRKNLGYGVFSIDQNDQVVHYSCLKQ